MKIVLTGAHGFVGRNLAARLRERDQIEVREITRTSTHDHLRDAVRDADLVYHCAGVNRSPDAADFLRGNLELTRRLIMEVESAGRCPPIVFTSSTQAARDNPYGRSKEAAEGALLDWHARSGAPVHIYRLPNLFGKWCRPSYNSVIATFCHNIARDLPIRVDDPETILTLAYIDDVVEAFLECLEGLPEGSLFRSISPTYTATLGEVEAMLRRFRAGRETLVTEPTGAGLTRALYATYVSYLPTSDFSYPLTSHEDPRGRFVEVLKTATCGQFSYFTAGPGITRGEHYHHTKSEKFLVVRGNALFRFRHLVTGETVEIATSGDRPEIVDTVPGWVHSIRNTGDEEMIVMLWANERFDPGRLDTYFQAV